MKRVFTILSAFIIALSSFAGILDAGTPSKLCSFGVRLGVNTSNRTVNGDVFDKWSNNAWGTGIDVGVVANLNLRNFISLQPGFFFESRSGNYAYASTVTDLTNASGEDILSQYGHFRSYNFTIPVMVSLHFSLAPMVRWNVEVGPYLQWIMKNSMGDGFSYPASPYDELTGYLQAKPSKFDFGFKFGTSLTLFRHFEAGVHYMAGSLDAWKNDLGGRNKAWVFTIGYDF